MKKTCVSSFLGSILLAASAFAQAPIQTPKLPVLSDAQKLKYFKALAEFQTSAAAAEKANQTATEKQNALQDAAKVLTDACGATAAPGMDASGDLVCNAKPAEPKK
jgi:hypothetical protein